ncbi:hypothetical protein BKA80DRAFT_261272 [Phyllosticta citrichinensis]
MSMIGEERWWLRWLQVRRIDGMDGCVVRLDCRELSECRHGMITHPMVREKVSRAYIPLQISSWLMQAEYFGVFLSSNLPCYPPSDRNLQALGWPCGDIRGQQQYLGCHMARCDVVREENAGGGAPGRRGDKTPQPADTSDERSVLIHPAARGVVHLPSDIASLAPQISGRPAGGSDVGFYPPLAFGLIVSGIEI